MSDGGNHRFDHFQKWGFNLHIGVLWLAVLLFTFVMLSKGHREVYFPFGLGLAAHGILLLMFKTGMMRFEKLPMHRGTGMLDELELMENPQGRIVGLPPAMILVGTISGLAILAQCIFCVMVTWDEIDKVWGVLLGQRSMSWVICADVLCMLGLATGPLALIYTALSIRRKAISPELPKEEMHQESTSMFGS